MEVKKKYRSVAIIGLIMELISMIVFFSLDMVLGYIFIMTTLAIAIASLIRFIKDMNYLKWKK